MGLGALRVGIAQEAKGFYAFVMAWSAGKVENREQNSQTRVNGVVCMGELCWGAAGCQTALLAMLGVGGAAAWGSLSPSSSSEGWESEGSLAARGLSCTAVQPGVKWAEKKRKAHPPQRLQSLARLQSGASIFILPSCPSLCFHRFAGILG